MHEISKYKVGDRVEFDGNPHADDKKQRFIATIHAHTVNTKSPVYYLCNDADVYVMVKECRIRRKLLDA